MDPVTLGLMGASLVGSLFGGDDSQKRRSFKGTDVDPVNTLRSQLDAIRKLSAQIESRPGVNLRSAVVQGKPSPVNIEGLPFQIGGGLGVDPALKDPSLLQGLGLDTSQTMSQLFPQTQAPAQPRNPGLAGNTRRRDQAV